MSILSPFLAAALLAAAGTAVVRFLARRFGLVAAPREDRWHAQPTALYGGVAIALAALTVAAVFLGPALLDHHAALAVATAAAMLFVVGVVDDARGLGPVSKLILQLAAATLLIVAGVLVPLSPWTPVNVLVTLFWFVGITNALNLLDNMDGVTAGVSAVAALGFAALFAAAGDPVIAALALAIAGAACGFLFFNFKPASIFMGDAGSLFLGGSLAGLGAAYPGANGSAGLLAVLVPALILLVPIMDTTLVSVTRTIHNRRITVGGRDHSTHRLVAMGFSETGAALFLYAAGAGALVVALSVGALGPANGLWLGLLFLTGALIFTGYLGRLHRYDDGRPQEQRRRGPIIRNILLKRRGLELLLDVVLFGVAYYGAFVLYFDASMTREMGAIANRTLGIAIVAKLAAFHYFQIYRSVWDRPGLADIHRLVKATLLGSLLLVGTLFLVARGAGIPRVVLVLDVLLTGALAMAARSSFSSLERFRRRLQGDAGEPVLVYGAGPEADLVLKAVEFHGHGALRVVGFVDDDAESDTLIQGIPVLSNGDGLAGVLRSTGARHLIFTSSLVERGRGREAWRACEEMGITPLCIDLSIRPMTREDRSQRGAGSAASEMDLGTMAARQTEVGSGSDR
jgi:UDP-GlcNAc:undecaprenyl-phosphate/decaprenyl-phosphate GlcNAc-1-phosphate transferase